MKSFFYGLFSILLMLGSVPAFAQIGIGTKTPAASAALEVSSTTNNKGILIPRLTGTQKDAIVSPAEGLLIYQTTAPTGFYYYSGSAWKLMAIQTDITSKVDKVDGKDLSTNDYTTAEKTKLSAVTGTNTGDQTTITGNAGTATKLATARNINGVAFDGSADITMPAAAGTLTGTTLKSTVTGSSLTSVGTLVNLTVTNPIAGSVTGNAATATNLTGLTSSVATLNNLSGVNTGDQTSITGNAATATKLAASKNINGVAFDGSADINAPAAAETLTGTTLKSTVTGSSLTSVGTLANLTVTNPIAGSVTGNAATATNLTGLTSSVATLNNLSGVNTGDQTSITGNAATATKLAASKNINGVAFDGSADINAPAAAETLTGTTLKSTVTGSSLTSVGTLANLTVTNPIAGSVTGNAANVTGLVAGANGGTGVANTGKTITLGGNLTTSGAFATTLTTTAATSITLPTSGTIATMAANVNVQTGTTYTLLDSDNGKVITLNNSSAITLTVPSGLSAGFNCLVVQLGAGVITFTVSSTTIYNRGTKTKTAGQYAIATIVSYKSDNFITSGDMTQ